MLLYFGTFFSVSGYFALSRHGPPRLALVPGAFQSCQSEFSTNEKIYECLFYPDFNSMQFVQYSNKRAVSLQDYDIFSQTFLFVQPDL